MQSFQLHFTVFVFFFLFFHSHMKNLQKVTKPSESFHLGSERILFHPLAFKFCSFLFRLDDFSRRGTECIPRSSLHNLRHVWSIKSQQNVGVSIETTALPGKKQGLLLVSKYHWIFMGMISSLQPQHSTQGVRCDPTYI